MKTNLKGKTLAIDKMMHRCILPFAVATNWDKRHLAQTMLKLSSTSGKTLPWISHSSQTSLIT